jgi:HlyD family secretion protein
VQAGDLLLQEADLSHVLVRAFVDEPDIGRLAPGQRVEVTWDAVPGRIWNGAVSAVPSTVKLHGTRNVGEATCVVDNRDFKLLPNINVNVTIITAEHKNALTVLREAIRMDDSKPYLYQIIDGKLKRREVEISLQNLTRVEITAGLAEGVLVALGTADSKPLYDGTAVKVVP